MISWSKQNTGTILSHKVQAGFRHIKSIFYQHIKLKTECDTLVVRTNLKSLHKAACSSYIRRLEGDQHLGDFLSGAQNE